MRSEAGKIARALLATCLIGGGAPAQDFPAHPIRLISPNPAGGANDTIGRIVANKLSEVLGAQLVIDNRGGGGGRTRAVNRAPACGMRTSASRETRR